MLLDFLRRRLPKKFCLLHRPIKISQKSRLIRMLLVKTIKSSLALDTFIAWVFMRFYENHAGAHLTDAWFASVWFPLKLVFEAICERSRGGSWSRTKYEKDGGGATRYWNTNNWTFETDDWVRHDCRKCGGSASAERLDHTKSGSLLWTDAVVRPLVPKCFDSLFADVIQ